VYIDYVDISGRS